MIVPDAIKFALAFVAGDRPLVRPPRLLWPPSHGCAFRITDGGETGIRHNLLRLSKSPSSAAAAPIILLSACGSYWQELRGGDWFNASDWSTGTVPGSGDDAIIFTGIPYQVSISAPPDAAASTRSLTLLSISTLALQSAGLTVGADVSTSQGSNLSIGGGGSGGSLLIVGGSLTNSGGVSVAGGYLVIPGRFVPFIIPVSSSLTVSGPSANAGFLSLGSHGFGSFSSSLANSGLIDVAGGGLSIGGILTNSISGRIYVESGSSLQIGGNLISSGTVNIGSSTQLTVQGSNVYDQTAGKTTVSGTLAAGAVNLGGGTLELASGGSIVGNLAFAGPSATLQLDLIGFSTSISGFGPSDNIDLAFLQFSSTYRAVWHENDSRTAGTLSIVDGSRTLTSLTLSGIYDAANFSLNNLNGTTQVTGLFRPINLPPTVDTSGVMILRHSTDGFYEIYDIGNASILRAASLGQVGTDYQVIGLGNFSGSGTADMMLRSITSGFFEVYDIGNNNFIGAASLGLPPDSTWQVAGRGDFNHDGTTDMMLHNSITGAFQIYDINNNQISSTTVMGAVGLDWQVAGFGDFNSDGTTDMMLRNSSSGTFSVYDIANNQLTSNNTLGAVGLDWQVGGFADFDGNGTSDMLLRNSSSGLFEVYDIEKNQISLATSMGAVGLDWEVAGFVPINSAGGVDLVLRNSGTGAFEIYGIADNQFTSAANLGQIGLEWQVAGFAPGSPTASMGSSSEADQLVQAMAGFVGGAAADGLNTGEVGAELAQATFLTTPQHA